MTTTIDINFPRIWLPSYCDKLAPLFIQAALALEESCANQQEIFFNQRGLEPRCSVQLGLTDIKGRKVCLVTAFLPVRDDYNIGSKYPFQMVGSWEGSSVLTSDNWNLGNL